MREPQRIVPIALRRIQKKHGLTVNEMAGLLDIHRVNFSHVINGHSALSIPLALRIEAVFGVDARLMLIAQLDEAILDEVKATRQAAPAASAPARN